MGGWPRDALERMNARFVARLERAFEERHREPPGGRQRWCASNAVALEDGGMLALSDQALARLAIAATAVAPDERAAWLEQLAERLDRFDGDNLTKPRSNQGQQNGTA